MTPLPEPLPSDTETEKPSRLGLLSGLAALSRKYFVDPFVSPANPPWFDARGVAVGLFIGLGVPLGVQMVALGLLRLFVGFNTAMAFAFTWVNNPISVIPMYYGYYYLGSTILGKSVSLSAESFQAMLKPMLHAAYFWEAFSSFLYLGWDLVLRWSLGAVIAAATCSILGYIVSYNVQKARCARRARQIGINYSQLLRDLEKKTRGTDGAVRQAK
ncbi:MAG: DUF2062 domain-containing protein [Desulfomonile tiedjei]|nr:DUF2062 domain-containing protein [Desulfomonile tiedjei]